MRLIIPIRFDLKTHSSKSHPKKEKKKKIENQLSKKSEGNAAF